MASTPQKNHSSHFGSAYTESNTPKKMLDSVDVVTSSVLKERNRKSDIFNREPTVAEPCEIIRSDDVGNDAACAHFRARQQQSNVFASEGGAQEDAPVSPTSGKNYKISNVFA